MKITFFAFLLFITLPIFSQEKWSLEDCIDYALQNNLDLQTVQLDLQDSKISLKQSKYNYLPTLNGNATHGYNWGQRIDPFTNQFASERVRSNNFYLSSSLTLFAGLENYKRTQIAQSDFKTQQYSLKIQQKNLKIEIAYKYLQLLLDQEMYIIQQKQLEQTLQQKQRTEALIKAGRSTENEQIEVEAQLFLDEYNLEKANNKVKLSELALQQLLYLPTETKVDFRPIEEENKKTEVPDLLSLSENKQAQQQINKSVTTLEIAKAKRIPTLSINGSLGSGFSGNNKELNEKGELLPKRFNTQLDENLYQSVTLNLGIPIFQNNQTTFNIQRAKIEVEKVKINSAKINLQLQNKIEQLTVDIANALAQKQASQKAYKSARLSYKNTLLKYKNGFVNYLLLQDTKTKLLVAQSNFIQSKYEVILRKYVFAFFGE